MQLCPRFLHYSPFLTTHTTYLDDYGQALSKSLSSTVSRQKLLSFWTVIQLDCTSRVVPRKKKTTVEWWHTHIILWVWLYAAGVNKVCVDRIKWRKKGLKDGRRKGRESGRVGKVFNLGRREGEGETKTTIHSVQKTANTTPYQSEHLLATHREEGRQEEERKDGGKGREEEKRS